MAMTLVRLPGMPWVQLGAANKMGMANIGSLIQATGLASGASFQWYGNFYWDDGGTHTIDTTGASMFAMRQGDSNLNDPATVFKFGFAAIDPVLGPPARAVVSGLNIIFDVSSQHTKAAPAGHATNSWVNYVPTAGSRTIATGDYVLFAGQMVVRGGTDQLQMQGGQQVYAMALPTATYFNTSYSTSGVIPNLVITAADGVRGYFHGGYICNITDTAVFNNTSPQKEYGNIIRVPFPCIMYGAYGQGLYGLGDVSAVLYSTPFATPVEQRSRRIVARTMSSPNSYVGYYMFPTPVNLAANTDYVIAWRPETSTSTTLYFKQVADPAHLSIEPLGAACCGVSRPDLTSPFVRTNGGKDLFTLGALLGGFDDGASVNQMQGAKVYSGSGWVEKPVKVWDGGAWT
jgi:hypothetical protein